MRWFQRERALLVHKLSLLRQRGRETGENEDFVCCRHLPSKWEAYSLGEGITNTDPQENVLKVGDDDPGVRRGFHAKF